MPLLGSAAMLLSFDIAPEAISGHDDWHTHEHLPERLSIPGFLRGTRWVALSGQPRYFVLYEVAQLATLSSEAYLQRLNHPSPWTSKMMPHYRGMTRGLCSVISSHGLGMGHVALLLRFAPAAEQKEALRDWLLQGLLPQLPARPGLGSVHLLEGALTAQMTNEQRIRGADAGVDWALLVTGYDQVSLQTLAETELGKTELEARGARGIVSALYRTDYTLTAQEVGA